MKLSEAKQILAELDSQEQLDEKNHIAAATIAAAIAGGGAGIAASDAANPAQVADTVAMLSVYDQA